ncbi:MAG: cytidine deaminase [Pseudomonadota bacterium]
MTKSEIKLLVEMAKKVRKNAYSPYFKVYVGAALLAHDGTIHVGCNVENASGSAIVCAESNAIAAGVAAGYRKFKAVAVVGFPDKLLFPCGVCRQKLVEFSPDMDVYVATTKGKIKHLKLGKLIPHMVRL